MQSLATGSNLAAPTTTTTTATTTTTTTQCDTNLVGCIDHKAVVIHAGSYEEAAAKVVPADAAGEWYFCRGVLDAEGAAFRTYDELAAAAARA
jgi:hypothetical protein